MSHVDLDQVADLDGGVLSAEQEQAVRGHLEHCDECSQLLSRVREVHTLLAAEPAPRLPASVAARLDDSLAEAARERESRTRVASLERARSSRRRWAPRVLAAAVGLAVVGGGAYVAHDVLGLNPSSDDAATSSEAAATDRSAAGGAAGHNASLAPGAPLALRDQGLNGQLRTALTDRPAMSEALKAADSPIVPSPQQIASPCVTSALGGQTPPSWASYRVTFDSRPAILVLSRAGAASIRAWIVECQPSPTVSTSTVVPSR